MKSFSVKNVARQVGREIKYAIFPSIHRPDGRFSYDLYGTEYGRWPVLLDSLSADSIVYCFGVGDDISFDLEVIRKYHCSIEAFDPTPRSIDWLKTQILPSRFRFHNVGISDCHKILKFYTPQRSSHVSYTSVCTNEQDNAIELTVQPLDVIMERLGHNHVDLLKMDIEGSEYEVLPDILRKQILPRQLCVEFHHGMYGCTKRDTIDAVKALRSAGYLLHYVSRVGREYGFHLGSRIAL